MPRVAQDRRFGVGGEAGFGGGFRGRFALPLDRKG